MILWNVSYKPFDEYLFIEAMNNIRPGTYNVRRRVREDMAKWMEPSVTTMVEMTEEEAFIVALTSNIKVERLE